jgi:two-component sensor histidine kinase
MRVSRLLLTTIDRTRHLPTVVRYLAAMALFAMTVLLRVLGDGLLPPGYPFLLFFVPILLAAALFDHGAGLLVVILSALAAVTLFIEPVGEVWVADWRQLVAVGLFVAVASAMAFVIESLHRAVAAAREARDAAARAERGRALLLQEFRHRTRNDLGSLVGLLYLRARAAGSEAVREGLREAAQHALALARVHTRLALADTDEGATIDTRTFVLGLCADLEAAGPGEGLRPIALVSDAESHHLDSERAVQLGLVLNEAVTNALKYAFPEGRGGTITLSFRRCGPNFVLRVADDGVGLPPDGELDPSPDLARSGGSGLGTRLLRGLAAQLRGTFKRRPAIDATGTVAELRFPVEAPGLQGSQ